MTIERVSVSLQADIRQAAQRLADGTGVAFSTVVAEALASHLRGVAIDEWLKESEAFHGGFTEHDLEAAASRAGVPYLPPQAASSAA